MPDNSVAFRLVLSGICLILMHEVLFAKCSAAHYLINRCAKTDLRAKSKFVPVYTKDGMKFAIDCESSGLLVGAQFSPAFC
ncbi:MAG: hypothetical protein EGQ92_11000 [Lactobacillus ruminis]|jgi:hypothetical protein|nr:hypothetical protein [Ligilactobacillus ruminis]